MNMLDNLFRSIRKTPDLPAGPVEFIVAGLGNPGKEYETTRHNAGFMAVDAIARKFGCKVDRIKYKSLCGEWARQIWAPQSDWGRRRSEILRR